MGLLASKKQVSMLRKYHNHTLQTNPRHSEEELQNTNKVSKGAKIRNQYNQVPHLTQDTNGKVTNSQNLILKHANNKGTESSAHPYTA